MSSRCSGLAKVHVSTCTARFDLVLNFVFVADHRDGCFASRRFGVCLKVGTIHVRKSHVHDPHRGRLFRGGTQCVASIREKCDFRRAKIVFPREGFVAFR